MNSPDVDQWFKLDMLVGLLYPIVFPDIIPLNLQYSWLNHEFSRVVVFVFLVCI